MPDQYKGIDYEAINKKSRRPQGNNHLLVIAIDDYEHCPKLSNCVKDAKDFTQLMQERYTFKPEHTYALYNKEASRENILKSLKQVRDKVTQNDNLIVYFSGHGEVEDEEAYWVPAEGKPAEDWDWVPADRIKRQLNAINSFHTLVIVDACFSGSFFLSYKSSSTRELLDSRRSRLGISASHSRERALDGQAGENSPFAKQLLKVLKYNQQPLPVDKLFTEVRDAVTSATKGKQTPIFKNIDVEGDDQGQFVFDPLVDEPTAWKRYKSDDTIEGFQKFILQFPESKHIKEAKASLKQLLEKQVWESAGKKNTIAAYLDYKNQYPSGKYKKEALVAIAGLEDDQHWANARGRDTISAYLEYQSKHPNGKYIQKARKAVEEQGGGATSMGSAASIPKSTAQKKDKHLSKQSTSVQQPSKKDINKWGIIGGSIIALLVIVFIIINRKNAVVTEGSGLTLESYQLSIQSAQNKGDIRTLDSLRKQIVGSMSGDSVSQQLAVIDDWRAARIPEMIKVDEGEYIMGCMDMRDGSCDSGVMPERQVSIEGFEIGKHEITNLQYATFLNNKGNQVVEEEEGKEPSRYINLNSSAGQIYITENAGKFMVEKGYEQYPVNYVSWQGANAYGQWLSEQLGSTYRLPSEAEWEYAARGGKRQVAANGFKLAGSKDNEGKAVAWDKEKSDNKIQAVGQLAPNTLGLYDLSGNVWEWCQDELNTRYGELPTDGSPYRDNKLDGPFIIRGGSFKDPIEDCRIVARKSQHRNSTKNYLGFRIVREISSED